MPGAIIRVINTLETISYQINVVKYGEEGRRESFKIE
tara:strand:+ start:1497 stop:1607 length:111 start_codon:yes stop_codon:yes gene_type:complete